MTTAQKHEATIASIRANIAWWEARGMTLPAARAAQLLQRIESGGDQ